MHHAPQFRDLSTKESHEFLSTQHVGRLAFTLHDRVDIQPVHFIADGDWIFGRTQEGAKITTMRHSPWCAFEADHFAGLFDWKSVVVKGTFTMFDATHGSPELGERARRMVQTLIHGALTAEDPVPERNLVFGVFINEITGRSAHR